MAGVFLKGSILPVTALEYYVDGSSEEYLLAGEGPFLKLFSRDGRLLCWGEVLPFVVHGIRPLQHNNLVMVFGQKAFQLVRIVKKGAGEIKLHCESEVVKLNDWILDAKSLSWTDPDDYLVVLVTSHNVLVSCKVVSNKAPQCTYYHSEVSCILYSAVIAGESLAELMIASGTVFNQILLWFVRSDENEPEPVRVSFNGHQGVIFSVKLSADNSRLVSASDDRSVRVWTIPPGWRQLERMEESDCLLVLYGHTARVWAARLLPNYIISIGEDATCRVWGYDGRTINVFKGHKGKSIWSVAVDRMNKIVATGGGDCSIRTYALENSPQITTLCCRIPTLNNENSESVSPVPRCVFLHGQTALCLTDQGSLLAGRIDTESGVVALSEVHYDLSFSGYSVGALSWFGSQLLALGNIHGSVKLIRLDENGDVLGNRFINAYGNGKVFSLHWCPAQARCEFLFSCGPNGMMICWEVKVDSLEVVKLAQLGLPPSRHRWPTTFTILVPFSSSCQKLTLLSGDRRGSLHLYRPSVGDDVECPPQQTLHGVHGPNGVTHSCMHEGYIYTCGRNGMCRKFELRGDEGLVELMKFKPVKGLDWLEKIVFVADDMLVLGFHGTKLVIHSTSQNRPILSVCCGGGHRSYATSSIQEVIDRKSANVLFIKQAEVYYCYCKIDDHNYSARSLIQGTFVGLEAISMALLNSGGKSGLCAVGSEDTSICLLCLPDVEQLPYSFSSMKPVLALQGHTSAVKALSTSHSSNKILLFSGGARASLKVWSFQESKRPGKEVEASLDGELYLHDPVKKKIKFEPSGVEVPPECRIMSLASYSLTEVFPVSQKDHILHCHHVAAGCSDAVIRLYIYDDKEKLFYPRQTLKGSEKCVLSVKHFFHLQEKELTVDSLSQSQNSDTLWRTPLLCCAATDGHVTIWDLSPFLLGCQHFPVFDAHHSPTPTVRFQVHQSGINDIAIQKHVPCSSSSSYLLASVGDDNALAITCFMVETRPYHSDCLVANVVWKLLEPAAHSSAITGVSFVGEDLVMSSSIDQRLNVWKFAGSEVELVSSCTHDVADASSLQTYCNRPGEVVAVLCGIGIQYFEFSANAILSDHKQ